MAVNFVVHEEHLWQVARYMPTSLWELDSLGPLNGAEIRYHDKILIALVVAGGSAGHFCLAGTVVESDRLARIQ